MGLVTERRLILMLIAGGVALFSWWGIDPQWTDVAGLEFHAPAVRQIHNRANAPGVIGEGVEIESEVIRDRQCRTLLQRYVFDGRSVRFVLQDLEFHKVGPIGPDHFRQVIPIPAAAAPGNGSVRLVIRWWCTPLDEYFPRSVSIDVPITLTNR